MEPKHPIGTLVASHRYPEIRGPVVKFDPNDDLFPYQVATGRRTIDIIGFDEHQLRPLRWSERLGYRLGRMPSWLESLLTGLCVAGALALFFGVAAWLYIRVEAGWHQGELATEISFMPPSVRPAAECRRACAPFPAAFIVDFQQGVSVCLCREQPDPDRHRWTVAPTQVQGDPGE